MKNIKTINGINFEIIKIGGNKYNFITYMYNSYDHKDLYDCYKKSSDRKVSIYNYWKSKLLVAYVASYNANVFTIKGLVKDSNTNLYHIVYITPRHNYILED